MTTRWVVWFLWCMTHAASWSAAPTLPRRLAPLERSQARVGVAAPSQARVGGGGVSDDDVDVPPLLRGRSPAGAVVAVAWPSVAIGLLRTALGQVDAWYIGRLGSAELAAIGSASFGVWVVYLLGEVGSIGVQSLSSEAEGAGDRRFGVARAVGQGVWFSAFAGALAFALASRPLVDGYLDYLKVTEPAVREAAAAYLTATARWGGLPLCLDAIAFAGFKGIGRRGRRWPASKKPSSVVSHSTRLTFGRAILSRNGLEA